VKRLPTWYGTLGYSMRMKSPAVLSLSLRGDLTLPPGRIIVKPPLDKPLKELIVNGKAVKSFTATEAVIGEFPADVELKY